MRFLTGGDDGRMSSRRRGISEDIVENTVERAEDGSGIIIPDMRRSFVLVKPPAELLRSGAGKRNSQDLIRRDTLFIY